MPHISSTTMIHPSAKADLAALAKDTTGKSVICANCGTFESKEGDKMKKCGACQSVYYCSRKCQADNWRLHKAECAKSTESPDSITGDIAIKLARRLATNQKLAERLHVCAILVLDLLAKPTPAGAPAPALRVRVRANPADTLAFITACATGVAPDTSRVLLHLGPVERAGSADVPPVTRDLAARMQAQASGAPVVVFLFTSAPSTSDEDDEGNTFLSSTWACPMVLSPLALERVRLQKPITYVSGMLGESKMPLTVENALGVLNATIHSDKKNSTKLRATRK